MAGPAIGLPSDKHSLSDDEEPEHYYSNGAPRPAIPRRDTSANPDREMFPLSGDGDLSNGYGNDYEFFVVLMTACQFRNRSEIMLSKYCIISRLYNVHLTLVVI